MLTHKQIISEVTKNFTTEDQEENNPHMIRMHNIFTQSPQRGLYAWVDLDRWYTDATSFLQSLDKPSDL